MLIDDSKFDNIINQRLLEINHFAEKIMVCNGGLEAFEFLSDAAKDLSKADLPEVIFLDINMPLMDGFEFLDAYAKLPDALTGSISIVMLTSSINPEDETRSVQSPFVARYLYKPLTIEKLESLF